MPEIEGFGSKKLKPGLCLVLRQSSATSLKRTHLCSIGRRTQLITEKSLARSTYSQAVKVDLTCLLSNCIKYRAIFWLNSLMQQFKTVLTKNFEILLRQRFLKLLITANFGMIHVKLLNEQPKSFQFGADPNNLNLTGLGRNSAVEKSLV